MMSQDDNQGAEATGGGPTAQADAEPAPQADSAPQSAGAGPDVTSHPIGARRLQFMLRPRQAGGLRAFSTSEAGLQPLSFDLLAQQLRDSGDVEFVRTIEPPKLFGLLSEGDGPQLGPVALARMSTDKARLLQAQAGPRLLVEQDRPLTFGADASGPVQLAIQNPGVVVPHADGFQATIEVRSDSGPLKDAEVYLFGTVWPAQAVTDASGRATLAVQGESPETIQSLYVKPKSDHWGVWVQQPQIVPGGAVNTVTVKPLKAGPQGAADGQLLGWGQRAMGLDQVPPSYNGAGVRVAVIDSGAAQATHRNLHHVGPGLDVVGNDRATWINDTVGHGSHCAGIIGGTPASGSSPGIRGFAPVAQMHVCRIFPGGRFSDLVSALDYCMDNGIDVVNLSLGGGEPSKIIEERIIKAKSMGVACIVAAGNSGGPVQFPALVPHVLAVAAVGKWGEFPDDSYHAQQALDGFSKDAGSLFPARFSCFGPEVDVCAPGVAIISSLPADGFGAWDGTSMATPHVTGLAALVLAHHPDFQGEFRTRDARRVDRLFQILKESATPLQFGDSARTGAGLPDAPRALGLAAQPMASTTAPTDDAMQAIRSLLALIARAAAGGQGLPGSTPAAVRPLSSDTAMSLQSTGAPSSEGAGDGLAVGRSLQQLRVAMVRSGLL